MIQRVLVVSGDVLPLPGYPTSGAGLRAWGLGQGLKAHGFEVTYAMPAVAWRPDISLPPLDHELLLWQPEPDQMQRMIRRANPEAVLFCHWPSMVIRDRLDVPTVIDFHGPHLLERAFQKEGEVNSNALAKIRALLMADYFICAGERQKAYFLAWLLASGIDVTEPCIDAVPVCLSPELPARLPPADPITLVYGGVYLPWQDPTLGLTVAAEVLARRKKGILLILGGRHPTYPIAVPAIFQKLEKELKSHPHVRYLGMRPHRELIEIYRGATAAMDLMAHNYERELAFTTRTVEYMWCGLPVIYNDYAELSPLISRYRAGWTLDPADRAGIEQVLTEILDHPETAHERGRNARRLVAECLTWDKAVRPLVAFLHNPRVSQSRTADLPSYVAEELGIRNFWERRYSFSWRRLKPMLRTARLLYQQRGLKHLAQQTLIFFKREFYGFGRRAKWRETE